jgi:hypothetical protein
MKDVWALKEEGKVKVVLTDDLTISRRRSPGVRNHLSFSNSGPGTFPAHEAAKTT